MLKLHDSEIISYEVNLKEQSIIMHTKHNSTIQHTDIVFYNVLSHFFENELKGSIIFDIEKHELIQFIKDNHNLLEKQKNYCWPLDYNTIEELIKKLSKQQYSYYVISSSYGLSGWVLAKNYATILNNK